MRFHTPWWSEVKWMDMVDESFRDRWGSRSERRFLRKLRGKVDRHLVHWAATAFVEAEVEDFDMSSHPRTDIAVRRVLGCIGGPHEAHLATWHYNTLLSNSTLWKVFLEKLVCSPVASSAERCKMLIGHFSLRRGRRIKRMRRKYPIHSFSKRSLPSIVLNESEGERWRRWLAWRKQGSERTAEKQVTRECIVLKSPCSLAFADEFWACGLLMESLLKQPPICKRSFWSKRETRKGFADVEIWWRH